MENANKSATPRLICMAVDIFPWESGTYRRELFLGALSREAQGHKTMRRRCNQSLGALIPVPGSI